MARIQLVIKGEAWMPLDVTPPSVNFSRMTGESSRDPSLVQRVTVKNNTEKDVELSGLRSTDPILSPELTVIEPGKKFEVAVRFASPPKQGQTSATIELTSNLPEMPKVTIPVSAFVAPDVEVMPATLSLPAEQQTAMTRQLNIRNNAKTPLELSDLQVSNPAVKVKMETTQAGTLYKINVELPADYKVSPQGDKITFKTTNPNMPEVTVPIVQMAPIQPAAARGAAAGRPVQDVSMEGKRNVDPGAARVRPIAPERATPEPRPVQPEAVKQQTAPRSTRPPAPDQPPPPAKPEIKPESKPEDKK